MLELLEAFRAQGAQGVFEVTEMRGGRHAQGQVEFLVGELKEGHGDKLFQRAAFFLSALAFETPALLQQGKRVVAGGGELVGESAHGS